MCEVQGGSHKHASLLGDAATSPALPPLLPPSHHPPAPRPLRAPNPGPERHGGRAFVHCSATWSLGPLGDRSSRYPSFTADLLGLPALLPDPNRSHPGASVVLHPPDRVGDQTRPRAEAGETTPPRGPAPSGGADRVLTDRMMSP